MRKTEAKFRTIGGNTVTWKAGTERDRYGKEFPIDYGPWECQGCGDRGYNATREKANQHAAACRAE